MTILVLGAGGQLASHLREWLPEAAFWGRSRFNLLDPVGLTQAIERLEPSCIVNAAAYTAVDKAEVERGAAWTLNAEVPAIVARVAAALDIPLLHVSTDYVFDGTKTGEYSVADGCNPLNIYGKSKLGGELAVGALAPKSWVLRTSWVFSEHGANFMKTMLRLAGGEAPLRVVADQVGRPTYAGDLAHLISRIVRQHAMGDVLPYGTHHAVGGDAVSWYEFAVAIVRTAVSHGRLAKSPPVNAITTAEYPTPARRPHNSVLAASPELRPFSGSDFDWVRGLDGAIQRMARMP